MRSKWVVRLSSRSYKMLTKGTKIETRRNRRWSASPRVDGESINVRNRLLSELLYILQVFCCNCSRFLNVFSHQLRSNKQFLVLYNILCNAASLIHYKYTAHSNRTIFITRFLVLRRWRRHQGSTSPSLAFASLAIFSRWIQSVHLQLTKPIESVKSVAAVRWAVLHVDHPSWWWYSWFCSWSDFTLGDVAITAKPCT